MSDSARNNTLLAAQLASLPLDSSGGLIPTPAEPGVARIDFATDDQGLHQGDIGQFGYTDDLTPTLGGVQEVYTAGLEITIYCNTKAIGTAIVGNDGHWSFTPDVPFEPNHEYIFNTVVADSATGNFLISLPYTLYTTEHNGDLPASVTLDNVIDSIPGHNGVTGLLHHGDVTNDNAPELSGRANAGARVNIYDNGELVGHTTANGQGVWSYTPAALSDGVHYLSASVFTSAGESHRSASFGITVDTHTETPVITEVYDNAGTHTGPVALGGKTDDSQPLVSGTAEAGSVVTVKVYSTLYNKTWTLGSAVADEHGHWSYQLHDKQSITNKLGDWTFTAQSVDVAGNQSSVSSGYIVEAVASNADENALPAITGITDDVGLHQGTIVDGGKTDDKKPGLHGTGEPYSTVVITMYGPVTHKTHNIATVEVGRDGTWSYQFTGGQKLQKGDNVFHITSQDADGHTVSGHSYTVDLVGSNQDVDRPDAPTIDTYHDNAGSASGDFKSGTTTDDSTPTLTGHAAADSVVKIYEGSTLLGSTTADKDGDWNFTPSARSEGKHTFTATATDAAGNASGHSGNFVINIDIPDTTAPDAPVITEVYDDVGTQKGPVANGGKTDDSQPLISGTAEAGSIVKLMRVGPSSGNYLVGSAKADSSGHWEIQTQDNSGHLGNLGKYTYTATAKDAAGNSSDASKGWVVNYVRSNQDDTTAPDAPTITNAYDNVGDQQGDKLYTNGTTDDTTPELRGHAQANSIVKVYEGSTLLGSAVAKANGTWSFETPARSEGKHTFFATATNAAGHVSGHSGNFVITIDVPDTTAPDAPVINTFHDNVGTSTGDFNSGTTTDDTTPTLKGHAEAHSVVKVYEGSTLLGSTTAGNNGDWSFTPSARSEGKHTFFATATDAAGHVSGHSGNFVVNVDIPSPEPGPAKLDYLEDNYQYTQTLRGDEEWPAMNDSTPTIHGTGVAGEVLYIQQEWQAVQFGPVQTTMRGSVTVDSRGEWSFTDSLISTYNGAVYDWVVLGKTSSGELKSLDLGLIISYFHGSDYTACGPIVDIDSGVAATQPSPWFPFLATINHTDPVSLQNVQSDHPDNMQAGLSDTVPVISLAQISDAHKSIAAVDITDHVQNALHLDLNDILSEAHANLFIQDGKQQLAVTGDQGDIVELKVDDLAHNSWQDAGQITSGGIQYEVYQHTGGDVELLVQHGLELHQVA